MLPYPCIHSESTWNVMLFLPGTPAHYHTYWPVFTPERYICPVHHCDCHIFLAFALPVPSDTTLLFWYIVINLCDDIQCAVDIHVFLVGVRYNNVMRCEGHIYPYCILIDLIIPITLPSCCKTVPSLANLVATATSLLLFTARSYCSSIALQSVTVLPPGSSTNMLIKQQM